MASFREILIAASLLLLLLISEVSAWSQGADLLKQGPWTVVVPIASCGSLPVLQVRGPATLFDSANATALADLQRALAASLAKACPGVREVILANGRSRKLVKIDGFAIPAAPTSPVVPVSASPVPSSGAPNPPVTTSPATPTHDTRMMPASAPAMQSAYGPVPVLPIKSDLPSLAAAHGTQGKCDVALQWLESGKMAAPAGRVAYGLPPQMIEIFRDETMTAVFGTSYDEADNRWRVEQYEKVFSKCLGTARPTGRPINVRGINLGQIERPLPPEYRQEFQQYSEVIRQAFEGTPGKFEPAAINRFVTSIRQQIASANTAMSSAAAAPATLDAFNQIGQSRNSTRQQLAMLRPDERDAVNQYLARRQAELAPRIVQSWLGEAEKSSKTPESAKTLEEGHRHMLEVLAKLDPQGRSGAEATYSRIVESDISQAVQAETAKLVSFPASWEGAVQLAAWETNFGSRFGSFNSSNAFRAAMAQFETTRTRLYPPLLPAWQAKVASMQAQASDIAARREELKTLFVSQADRATPLYEDFAKLVNARESEMQARMAADERRRLAEAERAAAERVAAANQEQAVRNAGGGRQTMASNNTAGSLPTATPVPSGPLSLSDLNVGSGPDSDMLRNLYAGDFDKLGVDRSALAFAAIMSGYIAGFWEVCHKFVQDPVELTERICDGSYWVTKNQYGLETSRSCANYVTQGTGVFAERQVYAAANSTPTQQVSSGMRAMLDVMSGRDPIGGSVNMVANVTQIKIDTSGVVRANSCTSPGLARFKENLVRFALGKEGMRLDGTVAMGVAMLPPAPGETYRDSNYAKLLDDMVAEQSKNWAVNRYVSGSIHAASVVSRDSSGRPARVSASYSYNGLSNRQDGNVTLVFEEGRPQCLYFSDQPNNCRTPDHRLTSAFIRGDYR